MRRFLVLVIVPIAFSQHATLRAVSQQSTADTYEAVLGEYKTGNADAAMSRMLRLPDNLIAAGVTALTRGHWPELLEPAVALHMEIGVRLARPSGDETRQLHFERAQALARVDTLPSTLRRLWYLAAAVFLAGEGELSRLEVHLGDARSRFSSDAEFLLYSGIASEMHISPRLLTSREDRRRQSWLLKAEHDLRQALEHDAGLVEARLRLGRVLGLRGDRSEARKQLTLVSGATAARPRQHYLAAIFLARVEEESGDLRAAETWYSRALEIIPAAQSARLGLSELQHRANDRVAAAKTLAPPFGGPDAWDPWFDYTFGEAGRAYELLADLRREARQ